MTPTISVIVPIYNVEKYLHRCIDSILAQTFTDFELLLIDDGSTDKSGQICDEYAAMDKRITVFHLSNGGVSSARNKGLSESKGEWLQFIDGDDWIDSQALYYLLDKVKDGTDMVVSNYYINTGSRQTTTKQNIGTDLVQSMIDGKVQGYLWNKFFRRSLVGTSGISFNHRLNFCEDLIFVIELCISNHGIKIEHNSTPFYHYTIRQGSLTCYPKDVKRYIAEHYDFIVTGTKILKDTAYHNENLFFLFKIGLKWNLLRYKCHWSDYKQVYPEVHRVLTDTSKYNSFLKSKLIRMTHRRIGFTIIQFTIKLAFRLKLYFCNHIPNCCAIME